MNGNLDNLQPYPFEKLNVLKQGLNPPASLEHIALSIGEPKHATPSFIGAAVETHLHGLSTYPTTRGGVELRTAISAWLCRRFSLAETSVDPERHVLPVNGTREALFAIAQTVVDSSQRPLVLMPNPFYQIYEGAALLAGAEPVFLPCTAETGFVPDFSAVADDVWQRCQLLYICTPGNPTGAVLSVPQLGELIELAERHDFVIASDECYSEIYANESEPPPGLLQAAAEIGNDTFSRCLVFHSLSKRSNAPGLRSGFVAGDADLIAAFLRYRTYHGCAMPLQHQAASILAWGDENHVRTNRALYREKFDTVLNILDGVLTVERPQAGFYLWPQTPVQDEEFAQILYARANVTVLPGSYLSREIGGQNPGHRRVRMALVAPLDECTDAAQRIRELISTL